MCCHQLTFRRERERGVEDAAVVTLKDRTSDDRAVHLLCNLADSISSGTGHGFGDLLDEALWFQARERLISG